jgi:hypothetical protein
MFKESQGPKHRNMGKQREVATEKPKTNNKNINTKAKRKTITEVRLSGEDWEPPSMAREGALPMEGLSPAGSVGIIEIYRKP